MKEKITGYIKEKNAVKYVKGGLLAVMAVILVIIALTGSRKYWELDSYAYPIISMEYRGTTVIEWSDKELMLQDFPVLYHDEYEYDSAYGLGLIELDNGSYISYYFPTYSVACLIPKIILKFIGANQELCFTITNAIIFWLALLTVALKLKASEKGKIAVMLMLFISPALGYVCYCSAELFTASCVIMSLAFFSSQCYRRSAIAITVAGTVQPIVMVLGMVYIVDYLIMLYKKNKPQNPIMTWLKSWKELLILAVCYVWVFVPFIYNYIFIKSGSETAGMFMPKGWLSRIGAYVFDYNMGIVAYYPVIFGIFIVVSIICIIKKHYKVLYYDAAFLGIISILGFIDNINCGMYMCARYVLWTVPIVIIGGVLACEEVLRGLKYIILMTVSILVSTALYTVNTVCYYDEVQFNIVTQQILNYFPSLYIPHGTTFWVRATNTFINDRNGVPSYAFYSSTKDGSVRKIIISGDKKEQEEFLKYIQGTPEDIQYLKDKFAKIKDDGQYHYVNIDKWSRVYLYFSAEDLGFDK